MLNIKKNASIFGFIFVFFAIIFGFSWGSRQLIKAFEQTNNIYYLIAGVIVIAIAITIKLPLF